MFDFSNPGGLEYMIMQSDSDADRVIALFASAINQGYNPIEAEDEVYRQAKVDPADFNYLDREHIQKSVNEIWRTYNGY